MQRINIVQDGKKYKCRCGSTVFHHVDIVGASHQCNGCSLPYLQQVKKGRKK